MLPYTSDAFADESNCVYEFDHSTLQNTALLSLILSVYHFDHSTLQMMMMMILMQAIM